MQKGHRRFLVPGATGTGEGACAAAPVADVGAPLPNPLANIEACCGEPRHRPSERSTNALLVLPLVAATQAFQGGA